MGRKLLRVGFALCAAAAALGGAARADVFRLQSGGRIVGELLETTKAEPPAPQILRIRTTIGAVVQLAREDVVEQLHVRPALEEYELKKPSFPDTVQGQWELAEWCRVQGLATPRKAHLARVVELDPDHEAAHRGLGHVWLDGKWVLPRELMAARGLVEYHGRWRLPQEVALFEARRRQEVALRDWFKKIAVWRDQTILRDPRAQDFQNKLPQLDDPAAARAMHYHLKIEKKRPIVRRFFTEALGRMPGPEAQAALMERAVLDSDREVRLMSVDHLRRAKCLEAIPYFIRTLKNPNNKAVNAAAYALKEMGDEVALQPLMDALETRHKVSVVKWVETWDEVAGGGHANGRGFWYHHRWGHRTHSQIEVVLFKNQDVLDALTSLSGQSFSFELKPWQEWYAAKQKAESIAASLRRE